MVLTKSIHKWPYESKPTSRPINQSTNQSTNQSSNHWTYLKIDQLIFSGRKDEYLNLPNWWIMMFINTVHSCPPLVCVSSKLTIIAVVSSYHHDSGKQVFVSGWSLLLESRHRKVGNFVRVAGDNVSINIPRLMYIDWSRYDICIEIRTCLCTTSFTALTSSVRIWLTKDFAVIMSYKFGKESITIQCGPRITRVIFF